MTNTLNDADIELWYENIGLKVIKAIFERNNDLGDEVIKSYAYANIGLSSKSHKKLQNIIHNKIEQVVKKDDRYNDLQTLSKMITDRVSPAEILEAAFRLNVL